MLHVFAWFWVLNAYSRFNGHPPLGVNATCLSDGRHVADKPWFQWAPTLGGECYRFVDEQQVQRASLFQWAPTLGGECYSFVERYTHWRKQFQWAPTLGGECYVSRSPIVCDSRIGEFQWAPTLGGECYGIVYLITPPLCQGVDALLNISKRF